jgi:hypothetical protein
MAAACKGGAPVADGLGEHVHEVENDEAKAVIVDASAEALGSGRTTAVLELQSSATAATSARREGESGKGESER